MPSYQYECKNCSKQWTEYHGYDETPTVCPFCEQKDFKKIYNYITEFKAEKNIEYKSNKTGQKTRQFIEESRKELQEQKESMRGK